MTKRYPAMRFCRNGDSTIVLSEAEDAELGPDWKAGRWDVAGPKEGGSALTEWARGLDEAYAAKGTGNRTELYAVALYRGVDVPATASLRALKEALG